MSTELESDMNRYIISLLAANRVGIMAAVTTAMDELGANLHEASIANIQNFFSIVIAADFPDQRDPTLIQEHIEGICNAFNVDVCVKDSNVDIPSILSPEECDRFLLAISGNNRAGILRMISSQLGQDGVDILDLSATSSEDNQTFEMMIKIAVPANLDILDLQNVLENICSNLDVSVDFIGESDSAIISSQSQTRMFKL
ncbi:ACT domain-containing protein [uncultured Gimesia sp.]|uniref:glycine cleavage system protein R n=1 Tax=uncultured Gimesia sp. TaxID=1678688 RepID=UPI0026177C50|nr:ACT domain-containing protein [uncultured Gimesia sp.]